MAKKIIDLTNQFAALTEAINMLLKGLDSADDKLKDIVKTANELKKSKPLEGYENIKQVEKGINDVEKASEELSKNEKVRIKLLGQLVELESEEAKINITLKEQIKRKNKELRKAINLELDQEQGIKNVVKATKENIKAKEEANKAEEKLSKNEKQRAKLLDKLSNLQEDSAKTNALLREEIRLQNKVLRESAKEILGINEEYAKQSKALNEARRQYKNLFLETENNRKGFKVLTFRFTKTGKELRKLRKSVLNSDKALKKLDESVGQGQRNVGLYERTVRKLNRTLKVLGIAGVVLKTLEGLKTTFDANSTSAAALDKTIGAITTTIGFTFNKIVSNIPLVINLLDKLFTKAELGFARLQNLFGGNQQEVDSLTKELEQLNTEINNSGGLFDGYVDGLLKAINASNKLVDATQAARLENIELNNNLSKEIKTRGDLFENLGIEIEQRQRLNDQLRTFAKEGESLIQLDSRLEEQSESNFVSLQDRIDATEKLLVVRRAILAQSVSVAKNDRDLAALRVKLSEKGIEDGAKNIAAREALAEADKRLAEVQTNATREILNSEREKNDIFTDLIERELDFIIDVADKRKAVNEDRINDDTINLKTRKMLLEENRKISDEAFKKEEEAINKGLREGAKILNFNELIAESDEKVINERVLASVINDKLAARALQIIKERIQFNRDLEKSERDLTRETTEGREVSIDTEGVLKAIESIRNDRLKLNEITKELEEEQERQQIENILQRLRIVEKGSNEEIQLRNDLAKKLLEQEQKNVEKQNKQDEDNAKKRKENLIKAQESTFTALSSLQDKFFSDRLNRLDDELQAAKQRTEELRALAANNVESATETLAFQQRKEAEIERKREQERKRQEKSKAFFAFLDVLSAKAAAGDPNALANTIADTTVLRAAIEALPSFFEGTDLTGSGNVDGKGGFLSVLHPNEMVMSETDRGLMGNPKTRAEVIAGYNLGKAIMADMIPRPSATVNVHNDNSELIGEIRQVKQAIKAQPKYTGSDLDLVRDMVISIMKSEDRTEKVTRKFNRRH